MKLHLLKTLGAFALGLAMMSATATDARAETITYTKEVKKSTGSLANVFDIYQSLYFPRFDDNLGELQKVTMFGYVEFENDMDVYAATSQWVTVAWESYARVSASAPGFTNFVYGTDYETGRHYIGPGVPVNMDSYAKDGGQRSRSDASALNYYSSPGGFYITVHGHGRTFYDASGPVFRSPYNRELGAGNTRSFVGVRYEYDPLPEPSTIALMGLVGAGALWRRRRKNRA